ncbi:hypothetical protein STIAU_3524 [Stigmatella aurantiaca DW4/3-1]|uniref:Uncharacterized protein n=1 Tax=Stigmatella aurantiaca (strain DW4/3-1) TaxID=378806 RepID=Q093V6_STIAD|nr:hypothetical protein STIAU_3524 [Stigmatella aurantiaca DW4/3-1]
MIRASHLMGRSSPQRSRTVFREMEAEARAWIAEQRANPTPAA